MQTEQELLAHAIKAATYRFNRAVEGSAADFGDFTIGEHTRTPNRIIRHMTDLALKTAMVIREGHFNVPSLQPLGFEEEKARLLLALDALPVLVLERETDLALCKKLLQGPVLDMVSHVGQLAMLNGLHGNKIKGESYFDASIQ